MSKHLLTVEPTTGLREVHGIMQAMLIRHVPVVEGKRLIGMVSDREVLLASQRQENDIIVPDLAVSQFMVEDPLTCYEHSAVPDVVATMIRAKLDCMPVIRGKEIVGIVTTTDLLRLLCHGGYRSSPVLELARCNGAVTAGLPYAVDRGILGRRTITLRH